MRLHVRHVYIRDSFLNFAVIQEIEQQLNRIWDSKEIEKNSSYRLTSQCYLEKVSESDTGYSIWSTTPLASWHDTLAHPGKLMSLALDRAAVLAPFLFGEKKDSGGSADGSAGGSTGSTGPAGSPNTKSIMSLALLPTPFSYRGTRKQVFQTLTQIKSKDGMELLHHKHSFVPSLFLCSLTYAVQKLLFLQSKTIPTHVSVNVNICSRLCWIECPFVVESDLRLKDVFLRLIQSHPFPKYLQSNWIEFVYTESKLDQQYFLLNRHAVSCVVFWDREEDAVTCYLSLNQRYWQAAQTSVIHQEQVFPTASTLMNFMIQEFNLYVNENQQRKNNDSDSSLPVSSA